MALDRHTTDDITLGEKLVQIQWPLVMLICMIAGVGVAMQYSAANGSLEPWAIRHILRFSTSLALMLVIALVDIRFWFRTAYAIYGVALLLLVGVEAMGVAGMGAQRWINLGFINLQPSEIMKVALVLALARYFHGIGSEDIGRPWLLVPPLLMVLLPAALVLKQPDLGTALMLIIASGAVMFVAGVRLWKFAVVGVVALAALPVAWSMLHDYQQQRVLTFLNPEEDPLGAGYHIIQSKIALGSGGLFGKGFLAGTQSHLNFLPEKQTDFIFTMLAEEFGLLGGIAVLALYTLVLIYGFAIAFACRNQFGRLLAIGVSTTLFLYVFINVAMVMGVIPVVGVPLPLISYGGTALLTLMVGFGLLLSAYIHRDLPVGRRGTN